MRLFRLTSLAAILLSWEAAAGWACSVPVFRYALERFPSDPYHFVVYHRGPVTGQAAAAVAALQKLCDDPDSAVNFDLKTVDLNALPEAAAKDAPKPDATARPSWTPAGDARLPWLAVLLPGVDAPPVWSAPLEIQDLPRLLNSPARREVVRRLSHGDSAVFLLLESGNKEEDAKTAKLLATSLGKLQKSLTLPADDGTGHLQSELPLKIAFSVLPVRRDDPQEQFLVKTLSAGLEPEQEKAAENGKKPEQGPIVYPIFGRGRILAVMTGKALTPDSLEDACQFLCGSCACSIKGQLPGGDLLLTADWGALLENRVVQEDPPALRSLGALAEAARAAEAAAAEATAKAASALQTSRQDDLPPGPGPGSLSSVILATLGVFVAMTALAGGLLWMNLRRREHA